MPDISRAAMPLLHLLEPETAHRLTIGALSLGLVPRDRSVDDACLATRLFDMYLPNPIGLAAGFDKDAEVPDRMLDLGFGFVEVGSITPRPQSGNPRPRIFRLARDRAVINRLGFNNKGLAAAAERLRQRTATGVVGANLGANRDSDDPVADYVSGIAAVHGLVDYFTVNVSSPNTPGLRDLQAGNRLRQLLSAVLSARDRHGRKAPRPTPVFVKIAPDVDDHEIAEIAEVALDVGVDGAIIGNTTVGQRNGLHDSRRDEQGGLSGAPLFDLSTEVLAKFYRASAGRLPLIGVGGVDSGATAYRKIRSGATLVQLYTALIFQGPGLVRRIKRELADLLRSDGYTSVADAVGADIDLTPDP